jgi:asparagine synthase (glutamine-hydrolysing)
MCGISGIWRFDDANEEELLGTARRMTSCIAHRGPDAEGTWTDPGSGIALGFRRLAILDLSDAGGQPMTSASGRYVIVFNGEIYNSQRLRERLERDGSAPKWRGHSDTEILLACIEEWGIRRAVESFVGMFAFAVWDTRERNLTLARDRLGVKPLYFALTSHLLVFASELRSIQTSGAIEFAIDSEAAGLYARFRYVPAPRSIYQGVGKLMPGSILTIEQNGSERLERYWDPARVAEHASRNRFAGSDEDAANHLEGLLTDAVMLRTIADVPLGVFLSGGVDSGLITALMQKNSSRAVSTFSIGFHDSDLNEAPAAAETARWLGTDHHEQYVGEDDALRLVPTITDVFDEPFADSSSIPTYLVSQIARKSVTVALAGDGGDELFAGYHRHFLGHRQQRRVRVVPRFLRPAASHLLASFAGRESTRRLAKALVRKDPVAAYVDEVTIPAFTKGAFDARAAFPALPQLTDPTELTMFLDAISYLPDDILTKVDRTSMAVSLEVRGPFLDHRVVELAWSLPLSMKIRDDRGKWILRKLLRRHLPEPMVEREKKGFGVPLADWLRGPLREWADSLLKPDSLAATSLWDEPAVTTLWQRHQAGENHEAMLWTVIMYQAWHQRHYASI